MADYLTAYLANRPSTSIVLSGPDEAVKSFRLLLPQPVQRQIIGEAAVDMRETHARILVAAQEILQAHERQEDQESVRLLLDSAGRGGLATLGLDDTLIALNAGLVHKLIMGRDFRRRGWRCLDCDNIGREEPMPPQCTVCNGQVIAVELGEAMVSEVLRADGLVDPVEADTRLASHDGVGALLRHK
jgi:peptide subunit release factor 1 (eRF1)